MTVPFVRFRVVCTRSPLDRSYAIGTDERSAEIDHVVSVETVLRGTDIRNGYERDREELCMAGLPPRRWLARGLLCAVVVVLVALSGVVTLTYDEPTLEAGVTNVTPKSDTVISSQGWHAQGISLPNRPAQLVSVDRS